MPNLNNNYNNNNNNNKNATKRKENTKYSIFLSVSFINHSNNKKKMKYRFILADCLTRLFKVLI